MVNDAVRILSLGVSSKTVTVKVDIRLLSQQFLTTTEEALYRPNNLQGDDSGTER